jgi:hypothetical protein
MIPSSPNGAGVPEHRLAVRAVQVLGENQGRASLAQQLVQHRAAANEFGSAKIDRVQMQEVEGA